jgi:hypothetical protein
MLCLRRYERDTVMGAKSLRGLYIMDSGANFPAKQSEDMTAPETFALLQENP